MTTEYKTPTPEELNKLSTLQDFHDFFEKIPEDLWCEQMFLHPETGQCCALGHLGYRLCTPTDAARRLLKFVTMNAIFAANNGDNFDGWKSLSNNDDEPKSPSVKQRVLRLLKERIDSPQLNALDL